MSNRIKLLYTNYKYIPIYINNLIYCGENIITNKYYTIINCNLEFAKFNYTFDRSLNIDFKLKSYPRHTISENISFVYKYIIEGNEIMHPDNEILNDGESAVKRAYEIINIDAIGETGCSSRILLLYSYEYETPNVDQFGIITITKTITRVYLEAPLNIGQKYLTKINATITDDVGSIVTEEIQYSN